MKRFSALHIFLVILFSLIGVVRCMNVSHEPVSESSEDSICDMALASYYPEPYQEESFTLRPYIKNVLRQDNALRIQMPRQDSREFSANPHSPMQDLLIRAAHQALKDKIAQLEQANQELREKEEKLKKRLSKKQAASISALCGFGTSIITLLVTLLAK